ncbi:MAG: VOC family protein [Halobacteriales archaeon]
MRGQLDHVTIAWDDLDEVRATFGDAGLDTDYGGAHDNAVTHMAVVGFDDGTYLELVSTIDAGDPESSLWGPYIVDNAGPTAWALGVTDVAEEAKRAIDAGLPVSGPQQLSRERPDGRAAEWDEAFIGTDAEREKLPFVIADRTPRRHRIEPSPTVAAGPLDGLETVVVAVDDIPSVTTLFSRLHRLPSPRLTENDRFDAKLATFPGHPVAFVTPRNGSILTDRLTQFGESPCAYLLGTTAFETALDRYPLVPDGEWGSRRIAWFDGNPPIDRLGVIETE